MMAAVRTLRTCSPWCAAFVLALLSAGRVRAVQNEQDAPPTDSPARSYLSLTHLDAYLELKGEFSYSRVERSGGFGGRFDSVQRNREWSFEERLGLRLGGVVLDPGFITFGGDLSFAFTQDRYRENLDGFSRTDRDSGHLLQYDLRMNLFQGRKLSGSIYGLKQDDRINRRFQPTLDQRRSGVGTSWVFQDAKVPMELSYDYLETDRTGNRDRRDDEHFTESNFRYALDWNISARQRLRFSYEHADTRQSFQGLRNSFDTARDLFKLEHEIDFGPEARHSLRTGLRFQDESGDFARDLLEIGPQLTLRHSDDLQTMYKYQFARDRYASLDVDSHRLEFQLVHQVYTNLTTTLNLFGLHEDVRDDIRTTQYGGSVDWQYNRGNRYGRLYANLALAYDTQDVKGDNGRRIVLDEAQAFRDPLPITLRQRHVISASIVVTDTTNRRVYRQGVDYVVSQLAHVTRLSRIQTGRIADGDTVLVDYQYRTPAHGKIDTIRVDFNIEQRFNNGLTPYYRLSYRNQEHDYSTGFARRADRTNHHRLGVNYDAKRYTLGAEFEIFDDTVEPYDAFHLKGRVRLLSRTDHTLDANARVSRLFFEGGWQRRNVTMVDVNLDHRWRLTENLSTIERIAYRYQTDSAQGLTIGWDVTAGLEFVYGALSGELTLEYDRLDLPGSEEDDYGVYIRLRREFPNVLVRR